MNYSMQYQPTMHLQTPEQKQMGLFLHLSQFANLILFPIGIILPIVLWQTQKDKMPALDAHGKMVVNWMISSTIYVYCQYYFDVCANRISDDSRGRNYGNRVSDYRRGQSQ